MKPVWVNEPKTFFLTLYLHHDIDAGDITPRRRVAFNVRLALVLRIALPRRLVRPSSLLHLLESERRGRRHLRRGGIGKGKSKAIDVYTGDRIVFLLVIERLYRS